MILNILQACIEHLFVKKVTVEFESIHTFTKTYKINSDRVLKQTYVKGQLKKEENFDINGNYIEIDGLGLSAITEYEDKYKYNYTHTYFKDKEKYAVENHVNKNCVTLTYYSKGVIHRDGLPALKYYNQQGIKIKEEYYSYGKLHREDNPASIEYDVSCRVIKEKYYYNGHKGNKQQYIVKELNKQLKEQNMSISSHVNRYGSYYYHIMNNDKILCKCKFDKLEGKLMEYLS